MSKIEVLAPCGSIDAFNQAINAGADAVYLGMSAFNARIKADNFSDDNIAEVISRAHFYGIKVYLTVNTLIKNYEVEDFLSTVSTALKAGVDALIIQDLGMATLVRTIYPDATLHASTQMGIHNLEGALFLQSLGFKRVVLSRETKIEDIRLIKSNTDLEIEYFVHGALCVAFSGNCYLSALTNGNSGNRGACKQLCRLNFSAKCGDFTNNGHLFSPKDLCLISNLTELIDAGVTSLKIEGRLKRPSYVYATVSAYKKAVSDLSADMSNEKANLKKIFSRGEFNENAYLYDNDDIIDTKHQSHVGEFLGKIINVVPFKNLYKVTIESKSQINTGDGLKTDGKIEVSFGVGNVEKNGNNYTVYTTNKGVKIGAKVYRIKSTNDENLDDIPTKRLPISVNFSATKNDFATLTLTYNDITVTAKSDDLTQPALNAPINEIDIKNQMKFNDTVFEMVDFHATVDTIFMPKSKINAIRRNAVTLLENAILTKNKSDFLTKNPTALAKPYTPIKLDKKADFSAVIINEDTPLYKIENQTIIYSPKDWQNISYLDTILRKFAPKNVYLNLPIIATSKDLAVVKNVLEKHKEVGIVANNYYALTFNGRRIIAGTGLNAYNDYTVNALKKAGAEIVLSSIEEQLSSAHHLAGNPAVMTFTHCPYKVVTGKNCNDCQSANTIYYTDERNNRLHLRKYKVHYCYFELLHDNLPSITLSGDVIDLRTV